MLRLYGVYPCYCSYGSMSRKTHHWRSSLYSRIIRRWRRQRWIWRQSWGFWLGSGSARTKQRNLWSKDCKNGLRMLRSRTSTLHMNVPSYDSLPESQCDRNFDLLLYYIDINLQISRTVEITSCFVTDFISKSSNFLSHWLFGRLLYESKLICRLEVPSL